MKLQKLSVCTTKNKLVTCFEMLTLFAAGAGDFYCSGNDLTNFTKIPEGGVEEMARKGGDLLR